MLRRAFRALCRAFWPEPAERPDADRAPQSLESGRGRRERAPIAIRRHDWRPAIRPLGAGVAAAAIGDVHGQDDLFAALADALVEEMAGASAATLVVLGDLVDRGPDGVAALRRARAGWPGVASVTLKGNHEDVLVRALAGDDRQAVAHWLQFGGAALAAELGVDVSRPGWEGAFRTAAGEDLVAWIVSLPTLHRVGDVVFVHAGLDPALPLDEQSDRTLMWTRKPWLASTGPYAENVAVIHGHTPQRRVGLDHPHRVNLDTGAFKTGALSGLVIVGDRMRVVQAAR